MKATIKNCVYDTERATFLALDDNGYFPLDDHYAEESLYQNPDGKYFLCRYSGSVLQCPCETTLHRQMGIVPVSSAYAKRWARHHMKVVDYVKHFGMPTE
jgi:hypothetical protein